MIFKTLFLLFITLVALTIVIYGVYLAGRFLYTELISDTARDKRELQELIDELKKLKDI